ncbi:MAG: hypothetical protein GY898_26270 [Proteobacteria bacterium]|nr:hypothetical protein [Pseudomonadota bacterium]
MLLVISTLSQVFAVAAMVIVASLVSFAILGPSKRDMKRLDWPERARHTWPARTGGTLTMLGLSMIGILAPILSGPTRLERPWLEILCVGTGWLFATRLRLVQERRLQPDPDAFDRRQFKRGRRAWLIVQYLQSLVIIGLMFLGFVFPGLPFVLIAVPIAAVVVLFAMRGGGIDLAKKLGYASDAPEWLRELVQERSETSGSRFAPST